LSETLLTFPGAALPSASELNELDALVLLPVNCSSVVTLTCAAKGFTAGESERRNKSSSDLAII